MNFTFLWLWPLLCFLNALMDAIDFTKNAKLTYLWHGCKWTIIVLLLWFTGEKIGYRSLILPVILGAVVWNLGYGILKRIDWRKYPWA